MSLYQREFDFKGVVFSNSPKIKDVAAAYNLTILPIVKRNKFKLPVFKELMGTLTQKFNASFYGYMNSDILMNPSVFTLLQKAQVVINNRLFPPIVELATRVKVVDSIFSVDHFKTLESCSTVFSNSYRGYLRSNLTAVCFFQ